MKKIIVLLFTIASSVIFIFSIANAQNSVLVLPSEAIISYTSNIIVNIDNSIDVTEKITYDTGLLGRHGIYRDIYPYSSQKRRMSVNNIFVTDENNTPYPFKIINFGENIKIKIGDPNKTFSGQKIYIIKYHATKAVAQLKDIDEIYWNVTGNRWNIPINQTKVSVILPSGVNIIQSACYYGLKGSTNQCQSEINENGVYKFNAPEKLNSNEGLTIAIGFQKGIVVPYSFSDAVSNFFDIYWNYFIAILLPILTFIFSLLHWIKKGKDAKGTGVIIPQYDVPDGLTPMEVGGIINEKIKEKNISAEIIYLATKGYLKIHQLEKKFIGLIKLTDYELIKLKDSSDLQNNFDQKLLNALFKIESRRKKSNFKNLFFKSKSPIITQTSTSQVQSIKLSNLKNTFYKKTSLIIELVSKSLLEKGYYKNLGRIIKDNNILMFLPLAVVIFLQFLYEIFFNTLLSFKERFIPLIVGIFVSFIIYIIFYYFSPAKTKKGVVAKEYILGLKDYLRIAEKDRLKFHNAPEKKPEIFEKLLPYAMVLGVANIWAKEFEEIYTTPPEWYSGSFNTVSAIAFNNTMSNFSSFTYSSLTSSPTSSMSGGSSGGGGGGGGGGSW